MAVSARAALRTLAGLVLLVLAPALECAAAGSDFRIEGSPYHNESTVAKGDVDVYYFTLQKDQAANWTVAVAGGLDVDAMLVKPSQVANATAGAHYDYIFESSRRSGRNISRNCSVAGDWALIVTPSGKVSGNSTYTLDLKIKSTARPQGAVDQIVIALIVVAIILAPIALIVNFLQGARTIHKAMTEKKPPPAPPPQIVIVNPPVPAAPPAQAPAAPPFQAAPPMPPPPAPAPPAAPPIAQCPSCGGPVINDDLTGRSFCPAEKRFV